MGAFPGQPKAWHHGTSDLYLVPCDAIVATSPQLLCTFTLAQCVTQTYPALNLGGCVDSFGIFLTENDHYFSALMMEPLRQFKNHEPLILIPTMYKN